MLMFFVNVFYILLNYFFLLLLFDNLSISEMVMYYCYIKYIMDIVK